MTAHCYLDLLGELDITARHSRPRVSNDNYFSEAQFKILKYQPDYPRRFDDHHHNALAGFTPQQVFTVEYVEVAKVRQAALDGPSLNTRNALVKDVPRYKCHHRRFASTQCQKMPIKKPLKKELASQPSHESLKSKLIIKELAQIRLICSGALPLLRHLCISIKSKM